jgi:signal transduction histidine kinase
VDEHSRGPASDTPRTPTQPDFTEAVIRAANGPALSQLIDTLLDALARSGGFDAAFVTVVDRQHDLLSVGYSTSHGRDGLVPVGTHVPLPPDLPERAYKGVTRSREATVPDPDSRIAQALRLRTYASVPIITADYRLYGMLCGASREAYEVTDDTIAVMEYFARLLVDQMARDASRASDERARIAERRLRDRIDFLAEAQHTLKTPLSVIGGWLEQLRAGTVPESDVPGVLDTLARRHDELTVQVERLLDELAADVRARELRLEARDLGDEIGALIRAYNGAERGRRVIFHSAEQVVAQVDPTLLVQIVAHLIDNAVNYSEPHTMVDVTVGRSGHAAYIAIKDHGIGLPDDVDVFAPFQRARRPEKERRPGVGLGLHIVRNLVHAMDGTIIAEANPEGGSTFTVTLPLTASADPGG